MANATSKNRLSLRELPVVTKDEALCSTSEDARMFLMRVLEQHDVECIPMESSKGCLSFVTAVNGLGYTLTYTTENVGTAELANFVRISSAQLERNENYDQKPREYQQYRIIFNTSAPDLMDPLEFAWLLSKYDVEVMAKSDSAPVLFVRARRRALFLDFTRVAKVRFGSHVFKSIGGAGRCGYEEIDF